MTPELATDKRALTLARRYYARYKNTTDVWAARPCPLSAPPKSFLWRLPLILENLSWHYVCTPSVRASCDASGWEPRDWRRRLMAGELPNLACDAPLTLSARGLRRWGLVFEQAFRQLGVLRITAPLVSQIEDLGNLAGWFHAAGGQFSRELERGGAILVTNASSLQQKEKISPRRVLYLENRNTMTALSHLAEGLGVSARHIQRAWPIMKGLYLPVCAQGKAHLPRPLLQMHDSLWDTLHPTASLKDVNSHALAIAIEEPIEVGCECGLTSSFVNPARFTNC